LISENDKIKIIKSIEQEKNIENYNKKLKKKLHSWIQKLLLNREKLDFSEETINNVKTVLEWLERILKN